MALQIATDQTTANAVSLNDASYDITGAYTICCWLRIVGFTSNTTIHGIFSKIDFVGPGGYDFWYQDRTGPVFRLGNRINGGGSTLEDGGNSLSQDVWYFVASVYVPSTSQTLYWWAATDSSPGTATKVASVPASITVNNNTVKVGNRADGNNEASLSYIDHLRVYSAALSQTQLELLRWQPAGVNEFANCITAMRLDNATTCVDFKGTQSGSASVTGIAQTPPVRGA